MAVADLTAIATPPTASRRGKVLRRVLRNPLAITGLVVLAIAVAAAAFAPWSRRTNRP